MAAKGKPDREGKVSYDVVIVGAGPGGMQAGIAAASEGLSVLLLEKDTPGGQIGQTPLLENSVFAAGGVTGPEFARMMRKQAEAMGCNFQKAEAVALHVSKTGKTITLADGNAVSGGVVVLACGNKWTELNIPGIKAAVGKSVHYGPVRSIDYNAHGRKVAVYGGGPSAGQAILALADSSHTEHAHALMRSTLKMPDYLVERIKAHPKVTLHEHATITDIQYDGPSLPTQVRFARKRDPLRVIGVAALFMCNGLVPNTGWLKGTVPLTEYGQIETTGGVNTRLPGVYAVGDCRAGSTPRVGVAIGDGSLAITEAWRYFKAHPLQCSRKELVA